MATPTHRGGQQNHMQQIAPCVSLLLVQKTAMPSLRIICFQQATVLRHISALSWSAGNSASHRNTSASLPRFCFIGTHRSTENTDLCIFRERRGLKQNCLHFMPRDITTDPKHYCDFYSLWCTTVSHFIHSKLILSQWFTNHWCKLLYSLSSPIVVPELITMDSLYCQWRKPLHKCSSSYSKVKFVLLG